MLRVSQELKQHLLGAMQVQQTLGLDAIRNVDGSFYIAFDTLTLSREGAAFYKNGVKLYQMDATLRDNDSLTITQVDGLVRFSLD